MSTCNQLDLQTLGSQPMVMPKNLPDHCLEYSESANDIKSTRLVSWLHSLQENKDEKIEASPTGMRQNFSHQRNSMQLMIGSGRVPGKISPQLAMMCFEAGLHVCTRGTWRDGGIESNHIEEKTRVYQLRVDVYMLQSPTFSFEFVPIPRP